MVDIADEANILYRLSGIVFLIKIRIKPRQVTHKVPPAGYLQLRYLHDMIVSVFDILITAHSTG